jgi:ankyrin repeat protein
LLYKLLFIKIKTGATPLYTAVEEGHFEICQLLLEFNADVNMCPHGEWAKELNINQQSPLLLACIKNNSQVNFKLNFYLFKKSMFTKKLINFPF